jgi:cysteine desulfurase
MNSLYLDNCATSPVDKRVAELVNYFSVEEYGNAGSRTHSWGAKSAKAIEIARAQIAGPLNANPENIIFTSGATESNNIALLGIAEHARSSNRKHLITTSIEHKAVLEPLEHLVGHGFELTVLPVGADGYPSAESLTEALRPDTVLVSTMHVNNETGVELPLGEYSSVLDGHPAYWHIDAAQGFGKANEPLGDHRIDLLSISGHKVFGPKGVGALLLRRRGYNNPPLNPLMFGGGQERGLRPGTLPVALVAGLGLASELAEKESITRRELCKSFRENALQAFQPLNAEINGNPELVLPHVLNMSIPGVDAEAAIVATKDLISISNGSACTSSSYQPSHVLSAMGFSKERIGGALRLSWSHETPTPDWAAVIKRLSDIQ